MVSELKITQDGDVTIVELAGEVNTNTAPEVQSQIMPLVKPGAKLVLDMTKVNYMSSAGLRVLLWLYRQVSGSDGRIVLVGLNDDIENVMTVTGFLQFFTVTETLEAGIAALAD